jgi:hypothetical protein
MAQKKLKGRDNLTKNSFCVGPVGPTDKKNQVKVYKKYCLGTLPLRNGKDLDPYQSENHDPDPYRNEKYDPDPYQIEKKDPDQRGLDPQH